MSSDVYRDLLAALQKNGTVILPPYSQTEIVDAFSSIGWIPSADVVELYSTIGGFEMGPGMFGIWDLRTVVDRNRNDRVALGITDEQIQFADFMLSSLNYWFEKRTIEESSVCWGCNSNPTLELFIRTYLSDPSKLDITL